MPPGFAQNGLKPVPKINTSNQKDGAGKPISNQPGALSQIAAAPGFIAHRLPRPPGA